MLSRELPRLVADLNTGSAAAAGGVLAAQSARVGRPRARLVGAVATQMLDFQIAADRGIELHRVSL
jgi:hypothetical protein